MRGRQPTYVRVSELAVICGVTQRTMRRRLQKLARRHSATWLDTRGGTWLRVNLTMLRREHPEMFDVADLRDLESEVADLKERVKRVEARQSAQGSRLREVEKRGQNGTG